MRRALAAFSLALGVSGAGCVDWLEVDDGEPQYVVPVGEPLVMPSEPALVGAPGPLVPRTPGLRVPLAGYWTRARLDGLDLLFPFTWGSLSTAAPVALPGGAPGDDRSLVVLRLEASTAHGDDPVEIGAQGVIGFRAVVPLRLPVGTDASVIRDGFELPDSALADAVMALRTSSQDLWLVTPTRLRFDVVSRVLVAGSVEGEARRGAKGQRTRHFTASFLALRAPDDEDAAPVEPVLPDIGGPGGATGAANPGRP